MVLEPRNTELKKVNTCPCCGQPSEKALLIDGSLVAYKGKTAVLRRKEVKLIETLKPGQIVRHDVLEQALWEGRQMSEKILTVHICLLRKSIRGLALKIETFPGVGYKLVYY